MPLIDDPTVGTNLLIPRGFIPLAGADEYTNPEKPPAPEKVEEGLSFFQSLTSSPIDIVTSPFNLRSGLPNPTLGAAFRTNNTIGSAIARVSDTYGVSNDLTDPTYSPWEDVKETPYEEYWKSTFVYSNNPQYTEALKRSIDRQEADRRTVEAGGAAGTVAGILAGTVDPTILIPVGGEISLAGKGVWTIGRGALAGSRAGAIGTAGYEAALQATQETRTMEESLVNISTGVVLGAVLGGSIAGALSRTQRVASEEALEHLQTVNVPGSMGAAETKYFTLDDMTINGTITKNIAAATAYSPNLRGNFREAPLAVQTYQELATNTLRQNMHLNLESLGPSIETNIKVSLGETIGQALLKHPLIYAESKKAGGIVHMSSDQFDQAVGPAMRRGDVGENDFVTKAAQMWRSQVVTPLTKQAIDLQLYPEDVHVTEAESYFTRMWNREKMVAQKPVFMAIATDFYNEVLNQQYQKAVQALRTRQADLGEEIDNMRLSPEDRIKKLESIHAARQGLEEANATEADLASQIKDLRAVERKAREDGDEAGAAAAKSQIESLKESGGEDYVSFKNEEAKLKKAIRQIGMGYAGMREKADALSDQLTKLSHDNFKSLSRLVKKGQQLAAQLRKLDPQKLQEKVSDLRSDFYAAVTRSDQAQDRLAKQIEKLHADEDKKVESALAEAGINKEGKLNKKGELVPLNKKEQAKAAKIEKEVRAANTAIADRLTRGLEQEKARMESINKLSDRLQAAEALDNSADLKEVHDAIDAVALQISNRTLGKGERASGLLERLNKLNPAKVDEHIARLEGLYYDIERKFYDKWEIKRLGEGIDLTDPKNIPDFTVHAKDMAEEVHASITGADYGANSVDPAFHLAAKSGPLKERTFHIPDKLIEDFLENDVTKVMERFSRTMTAQLEVARKFPGDPLLQKRMQAIQEQYTQLINAAKTEAERTKLTDDMHGAIRDIRALLEIHRGSYKAAENGSTYGRTVRSTMLFNYVRSMGGAALPSIADLYNTAIFHGFGHVMEAGAPALMRAINKQGGLIKEAHLAGVAERLGHYRLQTFAEIGDPYGKGIAIERLMDNMSRFASKWNGLNMLTDFEKDFAAQVTQIRMNNALLAGAKAKREDLVWLAQSGVTPEMRTRITEHLKKYATKEDGEWTANTDLWDDFEAIRTYRSVINFNVNADIVTRGIGDVPLFAYTPTGKALLQFKTFSLAAHQRTFLRSMQLGPAQFISGLIGLTTIGMFVTYLKALRGGQENFERFQKSAENPGYWIGEGLDATGLFTIPIELSNAIEKASLQGGYGVNPVKTPLMLAGRAFVPDSEIAPNSQRFANQGLVTSLAGPTAGLIEDVPRGIGAVGSEAFGEGASRSQLNAANRIVPYQSYIGMKEMLQVLEANSPYDPNQNYALIVPRE